jgi:predicted acyl esterase
MNRARIVCLLLFLSAAFAADRYEVTVERGVAMKTRDGVTLRADIYRPKADGKFPVLLERTPYNKAGGDFGTRAAALGYVVILQDVRGRFTSEGEWYPFKYEGQDGYDTVEWAAALPYANGKVGMFGAASRWSLRRRHGVELPRWLDLPGRRVRAMVQRVVDHGPDAGHA